VATYATPQSYQANDILTAPPGRLVVLLYDGASRFLRQAATAMRAGELSRANTALQRGEAIIAELLTTLDYERGGQIAAALRDLYLFFLRELNAARLRRSPERIDTVSTLLTELRTAWAQAAPTGS
jgi:flagellar protein FliS